jgi:hypothetical protein
VHVRELSQCEPLRAGTHSPYQFLNSLGRSTYLSSPVVSTRTRSARAAPHRTPGSGSPSPPPRSGRPSAAACFWRPRWSPPRDRRRDPAEQHQRTDELVFSLLRPGAEKLDLLPLFGWLDAPPTVRSAPHPGPPLPAAILPHGAGWKACHNWPFAAKSGPAMRPRHWFCRFLGEVGPRRASASK